MARIYYKRYKARVEDGEITLEEAIELVKTEVPLRWRGTVVSMLEADANG